MTARPVRGERLWMAAIWLFLCAWLFGVAFWKAPSYEHLYRDVSVEPPAPTAAVLAACAFVARWWFVIAPVMAVPLVLVLTGRLDGKRGPFTVLTILGLFVVIAFTSIYLFIPMRSVRARMDVERSVQPP